MAEKYFGPDAPWFLNNIPFLEIDDPQIQQIYFYRWKLLCSHIREIGPQGTTLLELVRHRLAHTRTIGSIELYFFADGER